MAFTWDFALKLNYLTDFAQLKPTEINLVTNYEFICIDINLNIKISLVLVYQKPKQNMQLDEDLYQTMGKLIENKISIIMEDLNSPSINWVSSNNEDPQLITFYNDNFLTQFVHEPTREQNILDIILASVDNIVCDVVIDSTLRTNDHNMVQFKLNVEGNIKYQTSNRLNYKKQIEIF